jgi:CO/xanthine dehydrogenase FAD-binding subunit
MSNLSYKAPATVDELAGCLALADAGTRLLGGGTDLVIQMRDRGMTEGTLVDLTRVAGLDQVELEGDWISIGANVTYAEMAVHPLITGMVPCLARWPTRSVRCRSAIPRGCPGTSPTPRRPGIPSPPSWPWTPGSSC